MSFTARLLHRSAWVALLAILGLAVVPTVSRLLVASNPTLSGWAELCTPQGTRWVALTADAGEPPAGDPPANVHLAHCPLCFLSAEAPVLPAGLAAWLPLFASRGLPPPLFAAAPRPQFAWAAAQPRGPPSPA